MAAFQIELLHRADESREPFRADRYDIHTPDLAATVVQARALFRALSPEQPTLVSFRIMENGLRFFADGAAKKWPLRGSLKVG
jgi:hypothetical protein